MSDPQPWEPIYRKTIDAYYEGDFEGGRVACDRLLAMAGVPDFAYGATRRNMVHYAPVLRDSLPGYREREILVPLDSGWSAFNPSIAASEDGYLLTVRTSNYVFEPPSTYYAADGGQTVRTRYQFIDLDHELRQVGGPRAVADRTPDDGLSDLLVRDNEDLRPFRLGDRWLGTAASWRRQEDPPYRMIRYGLFDIDVEGAAFGRPRWLSDGSHGAHEKNWMPAVAGADLRFVYTVGPTIVLGCDPDSGRLELLARHAAPGVLYEARGGPPLLAFGDGYLTLTHEVSYWEDGARAYLHRLVRFAGDFRVTHLSHPFRFHGSSIEYALGLARCGDRFVATFGEMDSRAWLAELDMRAMLGMLLPADEITGGPLRDDPVPERVHKLIERSADAAVRGGNALINALPDPESSWETLLDRSVRAFYEGKLAEGRFSCEWLQADPASPSGARLNGRNNSVHYAPKLAESLLGYRERQISLPLPPGWRAVNPTIAADGDGFVMLVRATNWSYERSGPDPASTLPGVVSEYWVQRIDASLKPLGEPRKLGDRTPQDEWIFDYVRGNEDYRLFQVEGKWLASASTWRKSATEGRASIRMGLFDLDLESPTPWVGNPRWMSDGSNGVQEKNWMPAVSGSDLFFVYGCLPTAAVRCDIPTGAISLAQNHAAPATAGGFRGGTQLIPDRDTWLALVHEFAVWEKGTRTYLHRIVRFGPQFNILEMSLPFRLQGGDIEFAAGLARAGDRLLISFGIDDESAWVASVSAAEMTALLRPLHELAPKGILAAVVPGSLQGILRQWGTLPPAPPAQGDPGPAGATPQEAGFTPFIPIRTEPGPTPESTTAAGSAPAAASAPAPMLAPAAAGIAGGAPAPAADEAARAAAIAPAPKAAESTEHRMAVPASTIASAGVRPFLVSVTMTGSSEDRIGDALRSAISFVDRCVVVDTGVKDRTLEIAREICGDRLVVESFPWINDFAAARNFSLAAAARTGAEWAMNLDTDERIEPNGHDLRAMLAGADTDAVFLGHVDGHYEKERFFRLPMRGQYHGPTHEAWWGGSRVTVRGPKFREEWKDSQGLEHKLKRDEAILSKHTAENPSDPRWWYYYGDTLANLEKHEEAIAAFEKVIELDGWDEEAGWAAYRAARILGDSLKRWVDAEAMCARGLTRHPAMVDLYWCAGYSAYWGGKYARAAHWARAAIAINTKEDEGFIPPRGGFKYPAARREGPWDVLRHSLRQLGNHEGAEFAEKMHAKLSQEQVPGGDEDS